MPYKVFVAGEEALAADANSYLMSQTVPRFTNAAQRTSQLTAPVLNQLSILDTLPGVVQYWNGAAWANVGELTTLRWYRFNPNLSAGLSTTVNFDHVVNVPISGCNMVLDAIGGLTRTGAIGEQYTSMTFAAGGAALTPADSVPSVYHHGDTFNSVAVPFRAVYTNVAAGARTVRMSLSTGGVPTTILWGNTTLLAHFWIGPT
jgi:hypothetical protein